MSIIRDVTIEALKILEGDEILLFAGARQVGKTTILRQIQSHLETKNKATYFLNLEDPDFLGLLNISPKNLFKIFTIEPTKRSFIFVDEVQYLNNPSNFLKYFSDEYRGKLKLIVSGSSAFYLDKKFKDSLAGRKKIFNVLTLNFREFLRFKEKNGLFGKDFNNLSLSEKEQLSILFREYIIYGGYPRLVLASLEEKVDILHELVYSYIKKDIYEANIRQDEMFYRLLKILSSQVGNLVNASELASTLGITKTSIDNYLYVLEKSFHICLIKPFYKNMRKELTKMPKVYFLDLGLRNFLVDNFQSFDVRADKGQVLENVVFRLLSDRYPKESIRFWRTVQKREVDFVVGETKAYEVKAGQKPKISFKTFLENYPNIKIETISLDEAWQKLA